MQQSEIDCQTKVYVLDKTVAVIRNTTTEENIKEVCKKYDFAKLAVIKSKQVLNEFTSKLSYHICNISSWNENIFHMGNLEPEGANLMWNDNTTFEVSKHQDLFDLNKRPVFNQCNSVMYDLKTGLLEADDCHKDFQHPFVCDRLPISGRNYDAADPHYTWMIYFGMFLIAGCGVIACFVSFFSLYCMAFGKCFDSSNHPVALPPGKRERRRWRRKEVEKKNEGDEGAQLSYSYEDSCEEGENCSKDKK